MSEFNIRPEKTAIKTGISNGTKYINECFSDKSKKVLDYGAGKLRNAKYLSGLGYDVSILDTPEQVRGWSLKDTMKSFNKIYTTDSNIEEKFDIILCSFVLNVIEKEEDRISILNNIYKLLNRDGIAFIEVRGERFVKTAKTIKPYGDGYILGCGKVKTFQKPYNKDTFRNLLSNENRFFIDEIVSNSDSLTALVCKLI